MWALANETPYGAGAHPGRHGTRQPPPRTPSPSRRSSIAIGGSASVYRAQRSDGQDIALKVLRAERANDPLEVSRMQAEFEFGRELADVEGVLAPLSHGVLEPLHNRPCLLFPFVIGEEVDYKLIHGTLSPAAAAILTIDIAQALLRVHARGVVHCDIKPSNIMITAQGELLLLDFGHALRLGCTPPTGAVIGSKLYMAPEQATGGQPSVAWDVYGLGMTLFEMLVGRPPYAELPAREALRKRCMPDARAIRVHDYKPRIPGELAAIVDALLDQDPAMRPSIADVVAALEVVAQTRVDDASEDPISTACRPRKRPRSGAMLGRYELRTKLGEGGCANVYRAHDVERDEDVALKVLIDRYKGRPERERLIFDEAAALQTVGEHPHIVRLHDAGTFAQLDGWPFLALEPIEGVLLEDLVWRNGQPMPTRRVTELAMQIALAVRHCHRRGVIHRDVTLSNVIVEDDGRGRAVLIDFSHSGRLDGARVPAGHPDRRTRAVDVPGTAQAMSPEQARAEPATAPMDVFGFGTLLYQMLTAQVPFPMHGDRGLFIALQASENLVPPLLDCESRPDIPPALAELTHACLALDPEDRPEMDAVVAGLEVSLASLGMPVPPMTRLLQVPPSCDDLLEDEAIVPPVNAETGPQAVVAVAGGGRATSSGAASVAGPAVAAAGVRWSYLWVGLGVVLGVAVLLGGVLAMHTGEQAMRARAGRFVFEVPRADAGAVDIVESDPEPVDIEPDPPVVEAEPKLEPKPKPKVRPKPKRKPRSKPEPVPSAHEDDGSKTAECAEVRRAAEQASKAGSSRKVLQGTKDVRCWKGHVEDRRYFRAAALLDLGHYAACVRAAANSSKSRMRPIVQACTAMLAPKDR